MKIAPFTPVNTLIKATKVSPTYVEQGDVLVTRDSLLQGLGFESGTFTPTVSNETFNEVVTPLATYYSRVNDVVNCTFFLNVALDTGQTQATFELSLPVATNFANPKDLVGIIAHDADYTELVNWNLSANTVNNTANIGLQAVTTGYNYQYIYITVQYLVL